MRIDLHYGPQPAPEAKGRSAQNASPAASSLMPVESGEDQAQLSGAQTQVAALAAQASQLPEVRQERVQALREVVHRGEYRVDPEKIADAIMAQSVSGPAA